MGMCKSQCFPDGKWSFFSLFLLSLMKLELNVVIGKNNLRLSSDRLRVVKSFFKKEDVKPNKTKIRIYLQKFDSDLIKASWPF